MSVRSRWALPVVVSLLAGCAARGGTPGPAVAQNLPPGGGEPASAVSSTAPQGTSVRSNEPRPAPPPTPLPGGEEPTPDKALPELRVEALGMHVGGGTNTPEEKAPFHRALQQKFPAFLECYRSVEDPWSGGSFGVDIKVPRAGGAPTVEQPRTRIRGAPFRECMLAAFAQARFERPKAGPTALSYSVVFTLGKTSR